MRKIIVMNSKGGCGKSTIATNLASSYSTRGIRTALFDHDPQGSSMTWLRLRDSGNEIHGVAAHRTAGANVTRSWQLRIPPDIQRVIIDTPASLPEAELIRLVHNVDTILIPVLPSPIDIHATADFIRDLLLSGRTRHQAIRIGIIANRVRSNTRAYQKLERFLTQLDIPLIARLRDTQFYLQAVEKGRGIGEIEGSATRPDREAWSEIVNWLESATKEPETASGGASLADVAAQV